MSGNLPGLLGLWIFRFTFAVFENIILSIRVVSGVIQNVLISILMLRKEHLVSIFRKLLSPGQKRIAYSIYNLLLHRSGDFFIAVDAETITTCNRRCIYCPNSRFERSLLKNERRMDTALFYKLINELSKIGFIGRFSPNFYDEPLMDKRLPSLLKYVRTKLPFANISLYSNGDLLTIELYKRLVASGVNTFYIAQHSQEEQPSMKVLIEYRQLHGGGDVELMYRKLYPGEITNRAGLIESGCPLEGRCCRRPSDIVTIDVDGNVILCCNDYFSSVIFGNIRNENLLDVWNKSDYKKLRKQLKRGIFDLPICRRCKGLL